MYPDDKATTHTTSTKPSNTANPAKAKLSGRGNAASPSNPLRQSKAKPIFDDLEEWLRTQLPKISGKSPLAKANRYALRRQAVKAWVF
jgi:hypothetical protein